MKGLLVHGCYDNATFRTIESLGVEYLGLDLRAKSLNLITFKALKEILPALKNIRPVLVFQDDSRETILSSLDLLKESGKDFLLEFRDKRSREFYESVPSPFIWYFSPDADWQGIVTAKNCVGVILPLQYQSLYHVLPHLWTLIEQKNLLIWLHAETSEEIDFFDGKDNIQGSFDLTSDYRTGARVVDQERLKNLKCWRKINECPPGQ